MNDRRGHYVLLSLALLGCTVLVGFFVLKNHSVFPLNLNVFSPKTDLIHTVSATNAPSGKQVNINTSTLDELQTLPGIGPGLAERILTYRAKNGPFASVAELTKIEGIGIKRLENLLEYITTGA